MGNGAAGRAPLTLRELKRRGNKGIAEANQAVADAKQIAGETEGIRMKIKESRASSAPPQAARKPS